MSECNCCHNHEHTHEHGHGHEHCHGHNHEHEEEDLSLKKILFSLLLFAIALLFEYLPALSASGPLSQKSRLFSSAAPVVKLALFAAAYLLCGKSVLAGAVKNILGGHVFDEQFLMAVASIGAIVIGEYPEAVAVMLFYQIGEFFQDYAVDKSRDSIKSLLAIRPDKACVLRPEATEVPPEQVQVGELILVRAGERIPLDGIVVEGNSFVDTSALTGESVPREVFSGAQVLAGFVNTQGLLKIQVTKIAQESSVSRILELVENAAEKKAKAEKFITRFARVYTPLVCFAAVLVAIVPPIFVNAQWSPWIYRALMFLVVSCPCALVISVPLSFYGGIGKASAMGILVKGSNYIEGLSKARTAVFDKTGTLTKGVFVVNEVHSADLEKFPEEQLIALAAHAEKFSNHPISKSLKNAHHCEKCDSVELKNIKEISGKGISVELEGKSILAGNLSLMEDEKVTGITPCKKDDTGTVIHIAVDRVYAGHIVISDQIKEQSKRAVLELKKNGIKKTVMLTGDKKETAERTRAALGIDEARAELLPEEKVHAVEELIKEGTLLFAGDGINDAPVLARADVGIAMGALGSDAAIEAADVVIMNDDPMKILEGIKIARTTMGIVWQNIIFSLLVKFAIMALAVPGIANMWLAVFGDVGVTVIAVLNAIRSRR